jgi:hypothetical protein
MHAAALDLSFSDEEPWFWSSIEIVRTANAQSAQRKGVAAGNRYVQAWGPSRTAKPDQQCLDPVLLNARRGYSSALCGGR